jgi:hypothetical protein
MDKLRLFRGVKSLKRTTVVVAQLVRASDCGSECRGFESRLPPLVRIGVISRLPTALNERAAIVLGHQTPVLHQEQTTILVRHVTAIFRQHVAEKFANDPKEEHRHGRHCDMPEKSFGDVRVSDFGPLKLKVLRQSLLAQEKKCVS